jgi:antirestriction protein ArdC
MRKKAKKDIRKIITDKIIEQMQECVASDYKKPWFSINMMPLNAVTKKTYRGMNTFWLGLTGHSILEFASYKQWQSIGAQVKKGETGYPVIYYMPFEIEDKDTGEKKTIPLLKHSTVFNCSQVDGYEAVGYEKNMNDNKLVKHAEDFTKNCDIKIHNDSGEAYYSPSADTVHVPNIGQFKDAESYYSVLFHEFTHATGAKKRLDRNLTGRFGDETYAFEELIAELGSAFTMAHLSLESTPRDDHAKYLKNWIEALKNDTSFIFQASAKAQLASDWMIEQQKEEKE